MVRINTVRRPAGLAFTAQWEVAVNVSNGRREGPNGPGARGSGATILIDRTEYHVPSPVRGKNVLTGLKIRDLAAPPVDASRDLYEIVPGGSDLKIDDAAEVEIHDGMRFFSAPRQINPGREHPRAAA